MITVKNENYFSPKEVAKKFDVHASTVARWRQEGKLVPNKVSKRKFLYSETAIDRFIKGEK